MILSLPSAELYYERSGAGPAVVLLHGNGEDHTIFDVLASELARDYTVYAVDSRGHGKSSPCKYFDYEEMAEDVAGLIRTLGLQRPALYGFSDGGILGLLLASRHPSLISCLAVSGANLDPGGLTRGCRMAMRARYLFRGDPKLRLMLTQPRITPARLGRIEAPTLVLAGSRDMVREEHTKLIARSIPKGSLRILPGETHGSYIVHSRKVYDLLRPFFSKYIGQER